MPLLFYSMSLDAVVAYDLREDPTLTVPMKLTNNGILFVKGQFIEEVRNIYTGSIPAPSFTMSFDSFDYYTVGVDLNGLNSGSNEWNNTTPALNWYGKFSYVGIVEWDEFVLSGYATGTSLYPSMSGGGTGSWSGSTNYIGRLAYAGIRVYDMISGYTAGAPISGTFGGTLQDQSSSWTNKWNGRTMIT